MTRARHAAGIGLLIVMIVGAAAPASSPPEPPRVVAAGFEDFGARASALLETLHADGLAPALSVAVAHGGRVVYAEARGLADVEREVPAALETRFRIGSTSKALTAVALGQLAEEGRLDLDAPIADHLPDLPAALGPITARQLAGHLSGIRHYRGFEYHNRTRYETVTDALETFIDDPLLFEPGTAYSYSTYGFTLLSAAMERADGADFTTLMRRRIFRPMGMTNTGPEWNDRDQDGRASFYEPGFGGVRQKARVVDNSNKWAGGGFESTPTDLATLGAGLLDGRLLDAASRDMIFTPQTLADGRPTGEGYGIGWRSGTTTLGARTDVHIVHHGGTSNGGRSFLVLLPEHGIAVSLLGNHHGSGRPFSAFASGALKFAALLLPEPPEPAAPEQAAGVMGGSSEPRAGAPHTANADPVRIRG